MDEERWKHAKENETLLKAADEYSEKLEIRRGSPLSNVFRRKMQRW